MKVIQFTRIRFVMIALSVIAIAGGLVGTIAQRGFNLGVDFQAGLSIRVAVANPDASIDGVRAAVSGIDGSQVQSIGALEERQFVVRVRDAGEIENFSSVMSGRVIEALTRAYGAGTVTELENTFVGPAFSQDLTRNTILLTSMALVLILMYIWFRFRLAYAVASIVTLVHDVAFMLVLIGAFRIEVSTATIAAILTIIGYSLNDTIVIFDRIRENETVMRDTGFETIINSSITQSLSRTLITSITTLLAVTAIFIFATGTVQLFALNLIIGVTVGTYSSIFVASPVLLGWRRAVRRRKARQDADRHGTPVTARRLEDAHEAAPSTAAAQISAAEKQRVVDEISRKRAASPKAGGRPARKKKK